MIDSRFRERRSAHVEEEEGAAAEAAEAPEEREVPGGEPAGPAVAPPTEPAGIVDPARPTAGTASGEVQRPAPEIEESIGELPEPSFLEVVQYLAFQAIQFLGDMPLNEAGERRVLPREAKHFIDLLGVLEDRTRGNLTPEEARFLGQILADLRVRYLEIGA